MSFGVLKTTKNEIMRNGCFLSSEIFTLFCQKIFMSVPEEREEKESVEVAEEVETTKDD